MPPREVQKFLRQLRALHALKMESRRADFPMLVNGLETAYLSAYLTSTERDETFVAAVDEEVFRLFGCHLNGL